MTTDRLKTASELKQIERQAGVPAPAGQFAALCTDSGSALLFSVTPGGMLLLTREVPDSAYSWQRHDLSGAHIGQQLPGGRCRHFAAARTPAAPGQAGVIHLAMVVNDGVDDHLYLSLANLASDDGWRAAPVWTACPHPDGTPSAPLSITAVHIGAASDGAYILVEVEDHPGGAPRPARYYLDVSGPGAPRWIAHHAPAGLAAGAHAACLGRKRGAAGMDGLYLAGTVDGAARLIYTPLHNPFHPALPPMALRLELPAKLAADSIAACRNPDDTTELYATAGGALYYFSAANQSHGAQAVQLVSSRLLRGVRRLYALSCGERVNVWACNDAGQVVHTSARRAHMSDGAAWSLPAVVLADARAIAPGMDDGHTHSTCYAQTAGGLVKLVGSADTAHWRCHPIGLQRAQAQSNAGRMASCA